MKANWLVSTCLYLARASSPSCRAKCSSMSITDDAGVRKHRHETNADDSRIRSKPSRASGPQPASRHLFYIAKAEPSPARLRQKAVSLRLFSAAIDWRTASSGNGSGRHTSWCHVRSARTRAIRAAEH